jgi:hypothetical protein
MIDVLLRHYPELTPALRGVDNAFKPWTRVHSVARRLHRVFPLKSPRYCVKLGRVEYD